MKYTQVIPGGREQVLDQATRLAASLAIKPPLALAGTKRVLLHSRDCASVRDGLDYVATWNSAQLVSEDIGKVLAVIKGKGMGAPAFSKL